MKKFFYNRTRKSRSIPERLIVERKFHLLPVYYLLQTSYLGAEAIENSGSYLLADHIYQDQAQGKYGIGWLLDRLLLSLPSAKSFRNRYLFARLHIRQHLVETMNTNKSSRVLTVPAGIPRDVIEAVTEYRDKYSDYNQEIICMDLDPQVLQIAQSYGKQHNVNLNLIETDALTPHDWPKDIDLVTSTGLGEFLDNHQLQLFYHHIYKSLRQGGKFITSAIDRHALSDFLLTQIAEIHTQYRDAKLITDLIKPIGFSKLHIEVDSYGLNTHVIAIK